jgi:hypothetical protein
MPSPLDQFLSSPAATASWLALILSIVAAGITVYFGAYLKQKAEAYAKSEDFNRHLQSLVAETLATEALKAQIGGFVASDTERLKAELSSNIETLKSQLQKDVSFATQVFTPRLTAYTSLWAKTYPARFARVQPVTAEERAMFKDELTRWYYEGGNGIFLSPEATELWFKARDTLSGEQSEEQMRRAFSDLRSRLKNDIEAYGPAYVPPQREKSSTG